MSPRNYVRMVTGFLAIALVSIADNVTITEAKSIASSQSLISSSNASLVSPILKIPNQIDDDDILKEYGRYLIGIMNQNMDPCEDFYEYSCGNWKNAEVVPEKFRNNWIGGVINEQLQELLVTFLKNTTDDDLKQDTAESKAKLFYSSCRKTNNYMERGFKQIWEMEDFTKELVPSSSNNETLDWISINFMSTYGVYPLLPLDVTYDIDEKKYDSKIDPAESILSNTDIVDVKNLTRDFKIENDDLKKSFTKELEDMIDFEKNLIAHAKKANETEDLPFAEFLLQHKDDAFNWTRYFDVAFNGTKKPDPMVSYNIEDIRPLVRFLNKTDLETLRNYVKWRTLLKFYNLWKSRDHESVESFCLAETKRYFDVALTPWLIENTIDADRRKDISGLAKQVRQTFYDLMDSYTWLDDETKSNARTKLSAMDVIVGYTDGMRHEVINHIYADLRLTDDWFENLFALESSKTKMRMFSINETSIPPFIENLDWANAHYLPYLNSVVLQIGKAQLPTYHPKFPVSMKFGGVGFIIGHETVHGFDSGCYKFDYNGKERNWWTESSLRNFQERYRCLESQYNKYFFKGVPTNGTQTSQENMADNGGIRFAYNSYMNGYGTDDGKEIPIPGLNFTNKELFFLKYAQNWCSGQDDAFKINFIKTNPHAIFEDRVRGPLSNMPEFSEVFKCKLGSNMNPIKKCVVW